MEPSLMFFGIALIITSSVAFTLAWIAWNRRDKPGGLPFSLLAVAVAVWTGANALEYFSPTMADAIMWAKVEYLGIANIAPLWLLFALGYSGQDHMLTRRKQALLWLFPGLMLVLVMTNEWHGLIWRSITPVASGHLNYVHGVAFWLFVGYNYTLILIGTLALLRALTSSPGLYRRQTRDMLIGVAAPWIGNVIYLTGLGPGGRDLTPFAFACALVAFSWSMFGHRLFDLAPTARHHLIEQMSDGMIVLDPQQRIVDINPAVRMLIGPMAVMPIGLTLEEALAGQPTLVAGCQDVLGQLATVQITLQTGQTVDVRGSPVDDERGVASGYVLMLRDISERVQAEAALEASQKRLRQALTEASAANQAKSTFLATMSHEIRTPVHGVIGMTDLLLGTELSSEQREYAGMIHDSAQGLMTLLNDVLDLSKIEAGRLDLEIIPLDLVSLVNSTLAVLYPLAREKSVGLRADLQPDLPTLVRGDPYRLRQVLLNLVGNALKFTKEGEVVVVVRWQDGHASFEVHDTGIGMDETMRKRLFQPFVQGDGSITRRYGGTGLGLAISRQLVERMGGSIQVESSVGQGSVFSFSILLPRIRHARRQQSDQDANDGPGDDAPALIEEPTPHNQSAPSLVPVEPPQARVPNMVTILIAEDNLVNQRLALRQIKKLGYDAEVVSNGVEAVDALAKRRYDLILMDMQMPEMDGLTAAISIRAAEKAAGSTPIPIVAMTANAMPDDRAACLAAGMNDYLTKPVKIDTLRGVLEQWIAPFAMQEV